MIEKQLPQNQFDTTIRWIKTARPDVARSLRSAAQDAMTRLGAVAGRTRAVRGVPDGSDQVDVGSVVAWMAKVKKEDATAVAQIVLMYVTANARLEG